MLKRNKPKELDELKKLIQQYSTIGVVNLHKMPARQLLKIKNNLKDKAIIRMSGKILIIKALKELGKDVLAECVEGEAALILTNEEPFKLYKMIKQNKAMGKAKVGDVVDNDILIKKGSTGIPPGPAISTLQKVGLKTRVEGGKIAVSDDKVVLKKGDKVTEDIAGVFSLLKIEPIEIALNLAAAWDGTLYYKDVLDIDEGSYLAEIQSCVSKAIGLSLSIWYPTKISIEPMLQKAFSQAKALCLEAHIYEKDMIGDILSKAFIELKSIEKLLGS